MKAMTLTQPWATLFVLGVKTVETRNWGPPRNLVGKRMAIHASRETAKREDMDPETWRILEQTGTEIPNGAIVATAVLTAHWVISHVTMMDGVLTAFGRGRDSKEDDQSMQVDPHGEYRPGRHLWVFNDIEPVTPPVRTRGYPGVWNWTPPKETIQAD